jgi:hypothetical protein
MSMNNNFRYLLSPDNIYKVTIEDYDGLPFTIEVSGQEILDQIRRTYLLDKALDNPQD